MKIKKRNDILLVSLVLITATIMFISGLKLKDISRGFSSGKTRVVDMELLQKRILEKTLSDTKAKYFRELP